MTEIANRPWRPGDGDLAPDLPGGRSILFPLDEVREKRTTFLPQCDAGYFLRSFAALTPPFSECARVGRRALSWLTWVPGLSRNSVLDLANVEISHQHITFEASKDNVGFGPQGLFAEETGKKEYRYESSCFDGTRMREAIAETEPPPRYSALFWNCQAYIERVLAKYFSKASNSSR